MRGGFFTGGNSEGVGAAGLSRDKRIHDSSAGLSRESSAGLSRDKIGLQSHQNHDHDPLEVSSHFLNMHDLDNLASPRFRDHDRDGHDHRAPDGSKAHIQAFEQEPVNGWSATDFQGNKKVRMCTT